MGENNPFSYSLLMGIALDVPFDRVGSCIDELISDLSGNIMKLHEVRPSANMQTSYEFLVYGALQMALYSTKNSDPANSHNLFTNSLIEQLKKRHVEHDKVSDLVSDSLSKTNYNFYSIVDYFLEKVQQKESRKLVTIKS